MMFLYLISFFLIYLFKASAHAPTITPEVINLAPLGTNATFLCSHQCDEMGGCHEIRWTVHKNNHRNTTLDTAEEESLNMRGIFRDNITHTAHAENGMGFFLQGCNDTSRLDVHASQMNNGSNITCSLFMHGRDIFSNEVTLIVIGPPPPPPSLHSKLISASEILLEWEKPFSWPGHDILSYTVTIMDLDNKGVNPETTNETTNETSFSYTSGSGEIAESCNLILFMVTAFNDVKGTPRPVNHSNGFPIAPREIGNISTIVLFQKDGSPQVSINIKPPSPVCDYQSVILMVEVTPQESGQPLPVKVQNYTGTPPEKTFTFHPERNRFYNVTVSVITVAGNISDTVEFDTIPEPLSLTLPIVLGGVAGILVILILTILFTFICCYRMMTRHKATQTTDLSLPPIVPTEVNPNKRDTIYECIDDDDYQTIPSATNDYHQHIMFPPPRPESPYQAMTSADICSPSLQKSFHVFHDDSRSDTPHGGPYITQTLNNTPHGGPYPPNNIPHGGPHPPNNDIHVTPGGSVLYVSRGSAADYSTGEGEYTVMRTPDHTERNRVDDKPLQHI